jgi:hypothetical protein
MNTTAARLIFVPYLLLGLMVASELDSRVHMGRNVVMTVVMVILCSVLAAWGVAKTSNGRLFMGMDRGLWLASTAIAAVIGCVFGYIAMRAG